MPKRRGAAPRVERCGVPRGEFATLPHKNPVFAWPPSDCIDFRQMNCLKIGAGLPARPRRAVFALFYVPSESGRGHSGETRFPPERSHGRSPYRSAERFAIFGVWGDNAHAGAYGAIRISFEGKRPHAFFSQGVRSFDFAQDDRVNGAADTIPTSAGSYSVRLFWPVP